MCKEECLYTEYNVDLFIFIPDKFYVKDSVGQNDLSI